MTFTKYIGLAGMMVLGASAAHAADPEVTIRIAAGASSNGNVCKGYLDVWGEKVKAASDGRIDYELYCDGTLAKMGDAVNRVEQGVADMAWDVPAAYGARFAGFNVIGVPGLYHDPEVAGAALWQTYAEGTLGGSDEVKVMWVQVVNNNSFFMANPMADYANFDGAKIGMGSQMRAKVIETMGGVPVAIKVPEYYQSLSKGAIDGIMSTAGAIFDFGMESLLSEVYEGEFGGGLTFVVMNQDFYTSLPDDLREIIDENSGLEMTKWASAYLRDREHDEMSALPNVKIIQASDSDMVAFEPAFAAARDVYLDSDPANAGYLAALETALAAQ
ncbi:Bacterial extracellular solute-binding protein, family 7 [Aquimixticola soesokkakensis]|uniref:Bacterial extracellular solute-binding protein, family 7 n=1 Tax=Aquimixticola soesokkakensis TaxID=1519096 RepID=A0A1Y5RPZ4_9RHOB|nr:TRAP transporter substrate-binding protein DctP [Aquimixticola soesokkakensis]SLN22628.1 Bacterial extracellular solute-binding protein, family 7 [Aquimixticola soesokkakensis]